MKQILRLRGGVCSLNKLTNLNKRLLGKLGVMLGTGGINGRASFIRKKFDKSTCNSRVTGKRGLRSFRDTFWCFFTAKICIKECWKFAYRFTRCGRNDNARGFLHKVEMARGRSLASYVLYLATIKILFCVCLAHAGQRGVGNPAAAGVALSTDSIKPLQIGDTIPDALWNLPLQMLKAGQEGTTTVTLNDYKGKLIILDFWATWCGPCVTAFPKMDLLRNQFGNKLALISVTTQPNKLVATFLGEMFNQTALQCASIVGDRLLSSYFPYRLLPHYVWIDSAGLVRAITGLDAITTEQIDKILVKNKAPVYVKRDVKRSYDYDVDLKDQVPQPALLKNSSFAAYTEGFSRRNSIDKKNGKITLLNTSIAWFYRIAFSEFKPQLLNPNRFIIEVKDNLKVTSGGLKGEALNKWSVNNAYCYELRMPMVDTTKLFAQMRADIAAFFPYEGKMEDREMLCLVLSKKRAEISLATEGGEPILKHDAYSFQMQNLLWKNFTSLLDMYYLQKAGMPFVDETGITGKIDLHLKARMADVEALAQALDKQGLLLKKERRKVPVIVLRDRKGGDHE